MSGERAQGRGWVRIPASRGEQPPSSGRTAGYDRPSYATNAGYDRAPYAAPAHPAQPPIYLSLVTRWREAGRTLPGHPDEEWERLISQPCWPGR
ncbi:MULTISPECIES: hypothetical protein [Streptomyces]|uniref:hypothetical protein n=1 Tax=Streptomyces TaxID=1883 RepID=UPI002271550C|nr:MULTISPECIES: hypothetical protein [unclassified Streptomyces]MCY0945851.1 hypothetical protein [Streptomyces sp. H34-AA3]MCY0951780.1 hypothetical protein [Streptomyces sp. H27-S2]MCZ4085773.1 hypothetical protein [Streptomyces sp. H34-S5]